MDGLATNGKHKILCAHTCTNPLFKHLFSTNNTYIMKIWLLVKVLPSRNPQPVGDLPDLKGCALSFERCGGADIGRRPGRIHCSLEAWRPWDVLEHTQSYHIPSSPAVSRHKRSRKLSCCERLKCSRKGRFDISMIQNISRLVCISILPIHCINLAFHVIFLIL